MVTQKNIEKIKANIISLYNSGEFGRIVSTIEDNLEQEEIDTLSKKIYAFSLIRLGHLTDGQYILEDILETNPEDFEVLNALGYIQIMKENKTASLNYLLDAEYYAPEEFKSRIKKNLSLLSEFSDISTLKSVIKPKDFLILSLPKISKLEKIKLKLSSIQLPKFTLKNILIITTGLIIMVSMYILISQLLSILEYNKNKNIVSQNIARVDIDSNTKLTEPRPILTNEITLSEKEILSLFNELKVLLSKNRSSNRARFIANYLLNSNASTQVKNRVEVLKTFMEEPEIDLDWQPLYEEINSKPIIYDGVYVIWKGKVVNVIKEGNTAEFTFVIQGKDESAIRGFIKARMNNFLDGYTGQTITVLGKIYSSKDIFLDVVKVIE